MKVTGAHTYNPRGILLDARVTAFQTALQEHRAAQASLKLATDKDWADTLGTPEEIQDAFLIAQNTLAMAANAIEASELPMIRQRRLLSGAELEDLKTHQHQKPSQGEKLTQD